MLVINFQNVEDLVFYDKKLQKKLPEFKNLFNSWALSKQNSTLRSLGIKSIDMFLNSLNDTHIQILKTYFNNDIVIQKLDCSIVKNYSLKLENLEEELNKIPLFSNLLITRDNQQIYISSWR